MLHYTKLHSGDNTAVKFHHEFYNAIVHMSMNLSESGLNNIVEDETHLNQFVNPQNTARKLGFCAICVYYQCHYTHIQLLTIIGRKWK